MIDQRLCECLKVSHCQCKERSWYSWHHRETFLGDFSVAGWDYAFRNPEKHFLESVWYVRVLKGPWYNLHLELGLWGYDCDMDGLNHQWIKNMNALLEVLELWKVGLLGSHLGSGLKDGVCPLPLCMILNFASGSQQWSQLAPDQSLWNCNLR